MVISEINWILADVLVDPQYCDLMGLTEDLYKEAGITGVTADNLEDVNKEIFKTYELINTIDCKEPKNLSKEDIQTIIDDMGRPIVEEGTASINSERTEITVKFNSDIESNTQYNDLFSAVSFSVDDGQTFDNSFLKTIEIAPDNNSLQINLTQPILQPILILIEAGAVKSITTSKINPAMSVRLPASSVQQSLAINEKIHEDIEIIKKIKESNNIFVTKKENADKYTHIGVEYDDSGLDCLFIYVALKNIDGLDNNKIIVSASCITKGYENFNWVLDDELNENYYKVALNNEFLASHDSGKKFNVTVTYDTIEIGSNNELLVIP